jgi:hypothetical protein
MSTINKVKKDLKLMYPTLQGFVEHTLVAEMCLRWHNKQLEATKNTGESEEKPTIFYKYPREPQPLEVAKVDSEEIKRVLNAFNTLLIERGEKYHIDTVREMVLPSLGYARIDDNGCGTYENMCATRVIIKIVEKEKYSNIIHFNEKTREWVDAEDLTSEYFKSFIETCIEFNKRYFKLPEEDLDYYTKKIKL